MKSPSVDIADHIPWNPIPAHSASRAVGASLGASVRRVMYACGPGNAIGAHESWRTRNAYAGEFSITYSSLVEDLCADIGAEAYLLSYDSKPRKIVDGKFTIEHRPKIGSSKSKFSYLTREARYALSIFWSALKYRPDVAVVSSGTTFPFCLWLFRLCGIPVVVVLHNSLWPTGFRPQGKLQRALQWLDATFWKWGACGVIGVSPECIRQVAELAGGHDDRLQVMRPIYDRSRFHTPAPLDVGDEPFRIAFFGRVVRNKGVFDILEMAEQAERKAPGRVRWEIWGDGPDLNELKFEQERRGLKDVVAIGGWAPPQDQHKIYARCHASIVPTRNDFGEGLAKTAVESVLSGRPVITNPVVPALEVLRPACVETKTNDIDSYVNAVLQLQSDAKLYSDLRQACVGLSQEFFDARNGLGSALRKALTSTFAKATSRPGASEYVLPAGSRLRKASAR
ncbi:MAG: glycosyltransferase [Hyphomicrobiales bacterium]